MTFAADRSRVERAEIDEQEIELHLFLEAIYLKFHWDLRGYSRASLQRRLAEALLFFECSTLSGLQERLLHDPSVFPALTRFLTVPVSDLFREAPSFLTLRRDIVPLLRTYPSLRLWIAGCSTGEEAYSHAILLAEEGLLERTILHATDINPDSLRIAQAGAYSLDRLATFTENHRQSGARQALSDHYQIEHGALVFKRELANKIVFSDHSLATDSVFSEMHLVSCRNVLIYFERDLQNRAFGLFKDSLCRRGFLCLGSPETPRFTEFESDFERIAEQWYRRC
jgi:chemotaxis protein methyltransferase CheR